MYHFLLGTTCVFISTIAILSFIVFRRKEDILEKQYRFIKSIIVVLVAIVVILTPLILVARKFSNAKILENSTEAAIWGQYGDFWGGLFGGVIGTIAACVASLYAYLAFKSQQKQIKKQALQLQKQEIENRFFELLKVHRDNFEQIEFDISRHKRKTKQKVLSHIIMLFKDFYPFFYYLNSDIKNETDRITNSINNTWILLFLGFDLFYDNIESEKFRCNKKTIALFNIIKNNTYENQEQIIADLTNKEIIENPLNITLDFYKFAKSALSLKGFQSALDKYFRHLFQTVKYINKQENSIVNYKEKYNYIKTLRAQLSNAEQAILFLNSMSFIGNPWEPNREAFSEEEINDEKIKKLNRNLITKYNFIKNIPLKYLYSERCNIDFTIFYPNIQYEHIEQKDISRKKLESIYT